MGYFKIYQKTWPRYGNWLFCVVFWNMYAWCGLRNKGGFCGFWFFKVFEASLEKLLFWETNFWINFWEFKFYGLRFWVQNVPLQSNKKSQKLTNSCTHQTRGHMGYFKSDQKTCPRYGLRVFVVCFEICLRSVAFKMRTLFVFL